jgi:hypothetical protein
MTYHYNNNWQPKKPAGKPDPTYKSEMEKNFPRIVEKIVLMWGANDFTQFLNALMIDDRGSRQGFPPDVVEEMMFLHAIHDARVGRESWPLTTDDYRVFK